MIASVTQRDCFTGHIFAYRTKLVDLWTSKTIHTSLQPFQKDGKTENQHLLCQCPEIYYSRAIQRLTPQHMHRFLIESTDPQTLDATLRLSDSGWLPPPSEQIIDFGKADHHYVLFGRISLRNRVCWVSVLYAHAILSYLELDSWKYIISFN